MKIYVTVELFQGLVEQIQAFRSCDGAEEAERVWLKRNRNTDDIGREAKSMNGIEFHVRDCELR